MNYKILVAGLLSLMVTKAWANKEVLNGGDLCENRIYSITEDLTWWLQNGGADNLELPSGLSLESYKVRMTDAIDRAKVSCTDEVLRIGLAEKTCVNTQDSQGVMQIKCNFNRFTNSSDSDQYVLVHHEFAGLAGIEPNEGELSNFTLSNQLSGFLQSELITRLTIKPQFCKFAQNKEPAPANRIPFARDSAPHSGHLRILCKTADQQFAVRLFIEGSTDGSWGPSLSMAVDRWFGRAPAVRGFQDLPKYATKLPLSCDPQESEGQAILSSFINFEWSAGDVGESFFKLKVPEAYDAQTGQLMHHLKFRCIEDNCLFGGNQDRANPWCPGVAD